MLLTFLPLCRSTELGSMHGFNVPIHDIQIMSIYSPSITPMFTTMYSINSQGEFLEKNKSSRIDGQNDENPSFVYPVVYGIITYICVCLVHGLSDSSSSERELNDEEPQIEKPSFQTLGESQMEIFPKNRDTSFIPSANKRSWDDIIDDEVSTFNINLKCNNAHNFTTDVLFKEVVPNVVDLSTSSSRSIFSEDNWY